MDLLGLVVPLRRFDGALGIAIDANRGRGPLTVCSSCWVSRTCTEPARCPQLALPGGLHATRQAEHHEYAVLFLDVVIQYSSSIFELPAGVDQPLLAQWNTLLFSIFILDDLDGIICININDDVVAHLSFPQRQTWPASKLKSKHREVL